MLIARKRTGDVEFAAVDVRIGCAVYLTIKAVGTNGSTLGLEFSE